MQATSAVRLAERRDRQEAPPSGGAPSRISARRLGKVYRSRRGDVPALVDIDLEVPTGAFTVLVGPSGCGKSTLLKCFAGLETVTSGSLSLDGRPVSGPPDRLGIVFQRDVLLDWRSVLDNVLLPIEFRGGRVADFRARALELLALYGLSGFEHRYPWELSGGMRQRAAICRAMIDSPELLLMDEPFAALDAFTRDELNLELQRTHLGGQTTVVFVTHSIPEAVFLADRVVVMSRNPGRIVEIVDVDLPRPRDLALRETAAFTAHTRRIREMFERLGMLGRAR